jgi:hypothetical protein
MQYSTCAPTTKSALSRLYFGRTHHYGVVWRRLLHFQRVLSPSCSREKARGPIARQGDSVSLGMTVAMDH